MDSPLEYNLEAHLRALERMYHGAPCNRLYNPILSLEKGVSTLRMKVTKDMHHSGNAVHGHILFKMLDDAAFFAANTLFSDFMLVTAEFHIYFIRPVVEGELVARGKVVYRTFNLALSESVVEDAHGKLVAKGSGLFYKSKKELRESIGYQR